MKYIDKLSQMVDGEGYSCLFQTLDEIIFTSKNPLDQNRIKGALNLRRELGGRGPGKQATVLEVLVTLAYKGASDILCGDDGEDRTAELFWLMMHNLGLDQFDDDHWRDEDLDVVAEVVYILLSRRYNPDGTDGSMFPIPDDNRDHRKAQLWDQLNWYLWENYKYEWR